MTRPVYVSSLLFRLRALYNILFLIDIFFIILSLFDGPGSFFLWRGPRFSFCCTIFDWFM